MKKLLIFAALLLFASPLFAQTGPLSPAYQPSIDTNCSHSQYSAYAWLTNWATKLRQDSGTNPGSSCTLQIYATQNEFADFQVHWHDSGSGTTGLKITVGNFVQTSPNSYTISSATGIGEKVNVYREAYLDVTTVTNNVSDTYYQSTGYYPDILIPAVDPYWGQATNAWPFTVAAGKNQSAWVDVLIPSAAPSGFYLASVTVQTGCPSSCVTVATMPVVIGVWQWPSAGHMPSTATLASYTGLGFPSACDQFYGSYSACGSYPGATSSDTGVEFSTIDFTVLMLDHRYSTASPIYTAASLAAPGTEFTTNWGPLFNGTATHNTSTILSGAELNSANFPTSLTTTSGNNWTALFNTNGWLSTLLYYNSSTEDEPGSNCTVWGTIASNATILHGLSPSMPHLVTSDYGSASGSSNSCGNNLNNVDILTPIINNLDPQGGSLNRSTYNTWLSGNCCGAGSPTRKIWSYQSCSSSGTCGNGTIGGAGATWPNYDADGLPAANRAMEWLTFYHTQTGELYYDAGYCWTGSCGYPTSTNDQWTSVYYSGGNGDGTLVYPSTGNNGATNHVLASGGEALTDPIFLPSIRLKLIRDGMQDYEYLNVLTNQGQSSLVQTEITSWITNSYTFNVTGTGLTSARNALGTALHEISYPTGNDVYIAQAAAGGNTGADCADAYAASYFNNSANWTSGTPTGTQIGPGTTVYLCGSWSMGAGASGTLQFQGSGTSGNPITVQFASGASATALYWGQNGFIYANGQSNIVVNGGSGGAISATANGTGLANQVQPSNAVYFTGVTNGTIENLSIANIYVHAAPQTGSATGSGTSATITGCASTGCGFANGNTATVTSCSVSGYNGTHTVASVTSSGFSFVSAATGSATGCIISDEQGSSTTDGIEYAGDSNTTITGNTIHDAYACIDYHQTAATASGVYVYGNTAYNCNWSFAVREGNGTYTLNSPINIYNNVGHDWINWDDAGNLNHHDCIFYSAGISTTGSTMNGGQIYNNLCYGGTTAAYAMSAFIYNSGEGQPAGFGLANGTWIYNNVLYMTENTQGPADGMIYDVGTGSYILNNTVLAACGTSTTCGNSYDFLNPSSSYYPKLVENNIFWFAYTGLSIKGLLNSWTLSDYNDFYNVNTTAWTSVSYYPTLANWQLAAGSSNDQHSVSLNPQLNAGSVPPYQPTGSTPTQVTNGGANRTDLCTTAAALCFDALGNARPSTGSWVMGAYTTSTSGTPTASLTPSSLTFSTNQFTTSATQFATLQNTGTGTLTVSSITVTGSFSNTYPATGTCGATPSLTASQSCTIGISFSPASTGAFSGSLSVASNASNGTVTTSLSGTGTAPTAVWTPTSYAFGNVNTGIAVQSSTLQLSNGGNGPLNVSLAITGSSTFTIYSTTCSSTLSAGSNCNVIVQFLPVSVSGFSGALVETDSVQSITANLTLTGTGITPPTTVIAPCIKCLL